MRLTFVQQVGRLVSPNVINIDRRQHSEFRRPDGSNPQQHLAATIATSDGRLAKAVELFVENAGRLELSAEATLLQSPETRVALRTPDGNLLKINRLYGRTPEEIDEIAAKLDAAYNHINRRGGTVHMPMVRMCVEGYQLPGGVTFPHDFTMSQSVVTRAQWKEYLEQTKQAVPEELNSTAEYNDPIVRVSWYDAIKFCNWKSQKAGLEACYTITYNASGMTILSATCDSTKNGFRLPTNAEWKYAKREEQLKHTPDLSEWLEEVFTNGERALSPNGEKSCQHSPNNGKDYIAFRVVRNIEPAGR